MAAEAKEVGPETVTGKVDDGEPASDPSASSDDRTPSSGPMETSINDGVAVARARPTIGGGGDTPVAGVDAGFYRLLMNPLMNQPQESANRSNEILDDLIKKMREDREHIRKRQLSSHIPVVLQGSGKELKDIIKLVESLIVYENYDLDQPDETNLITAIPRKLIESGELAIVSHSIAAYISLLDAQHLKHLATKVVMEVTAWLSKIFRFPEATAHFHEEEKEGLVRICQLAIHKRYPRYATDGYETLYPRPPVVYISAAAKHNLGQFLCHQIGLPLTCLCTVPCQLGVMDVAALQKLMEDDHGSGKTPVILIAYAGTPLTGRIDKLTELHELCQRFNIWLHLEGSSLSMLASPSIPSYLSSAALSNSMTLNLCGWLALPAVPFVTLFRSPDVILTRATGLSTFNVRYKLNCLSLWMCLLHLGFDRIVSRLLYHSHIAKTIQESVQKIETANEIMVLDFQGPSAIFRYQTKPGKGFGNEQNDLDAIPKTNVYQNESDRDPYFDTLNIWLAETLKREVPEVHVTAVDVEKIGLCIRFAPLETRYTLNSSTIFQTTNEDVEQFLDCLDHHIKILDATVRMRKDFQEIVDSRDNLSIVYLPTWAGLGAVQYIPDAWLNKLDDLPEHGKDEINAFNHQMVNQLKSTDSAFSLGQSESGMYCVRFGLVTMETDIEELITIVYASGKDIEESSKFLETMSGIVKQGIEKAAEDLVKENQDKLLHEGVLRQVPLVGSLINWWSPPPKDAIKGRTFNLASGKIVSTEETYKSHIQILESVPELPPKVQDGHAKMKLKPSDGRDLQRSGSESSARQEVGQGDEPAVSGRPDLTQTVVDGLADTVPDGDRNEEGAKGHAMSESRESAPFPAVNGPATSLEAAGLK